MKLRIGKLIINSFCDRPDHHLHPAVKFQIWIRNEPGQTITLIGENSMILRDDQKVTVGIKPLDAKGRPAKFDGVPTWAASNGNVVVTASDDGLSAVVDASAGADNGTVQVSVTGDADLGEGQRPVIGLLDVEVVGGEVATVEIVPGTPETA